MLEFMTRGNLITANDNWMDAPNRQEIIDSTIAPANDLESAILMTCRDGRVHRDRARGEQRHRDWLGRGFRPGPGGEFEPGEHFHAGVWCRPATTS